MWVHMCIRECVCYIYFSSHTFYFFCTSACWHFATIYPKRKKNGAAFTGSALPFDLPLTRGFTRPSSVMSAAPMAARNLPAHNFSPPCLSYEAQVNLHALLGHETVFQLPETVQLCVDIWYGRPGAGTGAGISGECERRREEPEIGGREPSERERQRDPVKEEKCEIHYPSLL